MIEVYVQQLLDIMAACPLVQISNLTLDKRVPQAALIRGELTFIDGSRLYFRELIEMRNVIVRHMYSYHYQDDEGVLIFRYDDTRHHPDVDTFPHHKHHRAEDNVLATDPPDMESVIREIELM